MKNLNLKFLGLGLVIAQAMFMMSCGQNNNSSGRCDTRNPSGCGGSVTAQANTDIVPQGLFWGNDQNLFQTAAAQLVSATVTANSLGNVNDGQGTADNTGIAFGAKVSLATGKATSAGANTQIAAGSRLLIAVYDSLVGQQASTGQLIGPILIPMSTATGTAGGGAANIIFNDSFGTIQFTGNYNATTFTGVVQFTNTSVVGGGASVTNQFNFQIPTCSFFVCN
jgi:hypothetical protein